MTAVWLRARARAAVASVAIVAATAATTLMVAAANAPVRLVGVSTQGSAVVIEATDPVAYTVNRPDALTLVVDLRDASVGDIAPRVQPQGVVSSIRLEQATAADGLSVARVRITLGRAAEYSVKSARNTIRVELASAAGATTASAPPMPAPVAASPRRPVAAPPAPALEKAAPRDPVVAASALKDAPVSDVAATTIEQVRATRKGTGSVVTILGNGKLAPTGVSETRDLPRRLVLDFPNVSTKVAAQTTGDGEIVRRVRVGVNSQAPLVTRVVMEIAEGATYTLQRGAAGGRELSVLFEPARVTGTSLRGPAADDSSFALLGAETITLAQALANGAALAPREAATDAMVASTGASTTSAPARLPAPSPSSGAAILQARQSGAGQVAPGTQAQTPAPQQPSAPAPVTSPVLQGPHSQQIAVGQEKKYVGHPISMDFSGTDLRSVLRLFAEISGLNMIIDPDVQGSVDVVFNDVPWDQALDVILRQAQLDYTVDGTIIRIARMDTLRREQDSRTQLAASAANAGALAVRTYTLSYAKADQAAPLVQRAVLSTRGNVQIDARTNTLIITDLPARLDTVAQLLTTLDRAEPQVEIEARIITTTRDFARALGVQWGFNGRVVAGNRQHDEPGVPEQRFARRASGRPAGQRGLRRSRQSQRRRGNRRQSGRAGSEQRRRPRAGLDQRRLQSRHRAVGARTLRQGPHPVDAAGHHAEQRRGRDHAGRADSRADRGQQHRHRDVQGRRADAQGDAADYRRQHRDHADHARERLSRRARQHRHGVDSLDRHPAGDHQGSGQRRHDHRHGRHLRQP